MADAENQNAPPNPQAHLTEGLAILLALASILFALVGNILSHFDFVKSPSADAASCDCKPNNCPCLPPFYIFSIVATAALSVVWFGIFVLSARFQYRFVIWVGLGLVWATYWLALRCFLTPQFFHPMVYSFNSILSLLTVLLLFNIRFRYVLDRVMHVLSDNWDRTIHVIADIWVLFWNYITRSL